MILRKHLSENTVKYHRTKTEEEEVGEEYSRHLQQIERKHEAVCTNHQENVDSMQGIDSLSLDQFMLTDFIRMMEKVGIDQAARGEALGATPEDSDVVASGKGKGKARAEPSKKAASKARAVQGNLWAQMALAFMNRSHHYHHADLFEMKTMASWMPAYQGVRVSRGQDQCMKLIIIIIVRSSRRISSAGFSGSILSCRRTKFSRKRAKSLMR